MDLLVHEPLQRPAKGSFMVRTPLPIAILACGALLASPAVAQSVLYTLPSGSGSGDFFGRFMAAVGDVDGDGRTDFVVSGAVSGPTTTVSLRSGVDGHVLRSWSGPFLDRFGADVAGPGDVDGDGVPDVLVGVPLDGTVTFQAGKAVVYSGATGAQIGVTYGNAVGANCGKEVFGVGDEDGDGRAEFGVFSGTAYEIHSGATGALRFSVGPVNLFDYKQNVLALGDVNADGAGDFACGFLGGNLPGYVEVHSGADGSLLRTIQGTQNMDEFGWKLADAGDFDHDGVHEMLVAATGYGAVNGRVSVVSPVTGATLLSVTGLTATDPCGRGLAGGGDVDGDGTPDIVTVGFDASLGTAPWPYYFACFSGATGGLIAYSRLDMLQGVTNGGHYATAMLGDLDADGKAEFAVGLVESPNRVSVFRGAAPYAQPGSTSCSGDGSVAPCPCGNLGASGEGCRNLTGNGARLTEFGSASLGSDQIAFVAEQLPTTNTPALLFVGVQAAPVPFGDGLRCTGAPVRLGLGVLQAPGTRAWGLHPAAIPGTSAGSMRTFQVIYRTSTASECHSGSNLTNARTITFLP